ncbi:MAG: hypothetical protein E7266_03725 [Lachnospiraceae bacterium]|nr:hypothetical protein [Lachnospiraceae bacterium]
MNNKSLDKALDIVSALIVGDEVSRNGQNAGLYNEYTSNGEVYDIVLEVLKKLNINIYEYNYSLYITAGDNNRVFGYTNEELKKELGIRLNKELYLCYFIMYNIISVFYPDSSSYSYVEYTRVEDVIEAVNGSLAGVISNLKVLSLDEVEENSFKEIGLIWEDMPISGGEDIMLKASRGSKAGIVKLVFNFFVNQKLVLESEGRYYPKEKMKALVENYFDSEKSRLYEIMSASKEVKSEN